MPTYEYECPEGHTFEKFQKMTDKPRTKCPVCGKLATRKISGGAGLVFRGSGFYITDYGKDGKGPRKAETEKPAPEKTSESKSEGATKETKPKPEPSSSKQTPGKGRGKASEE
ncbi:MAG TPA: zinc ribbon domain-containing protein [Gemmatimonadales bacterium]|nr:zinc ribbon domain-containing protein [Gemmatimonadales bacterium]